MMGLKEYQISNTTVQISQTVLTAYIGDVSFGIDGFTGLQMRPWEHDSNGFGESIRAKGA